MCSPRYNKTAKRLGTKSEVGYIASMRLFYWHFFVLQTSLCKKYPNFFSTNPRHEKMMESKEFQYSANTSNYTLCIFFTRITRKWIGESSSFLKTSSHSLFIFTREAYFKNEREVTPRAIHIEQWNIHEWPWNTTIHPQRVNLMWYSLCKTVSCGEEKDSVLL